MKRLLKESDYLCPTTILKMQFLRSLNGPRTWHRGEGCMTLMSPLPFVTFPQLTCSLVWLKNCVHRTSTFLLVVTRNCYLFTFYFEPRHKMLQREFWQFSIPNEHEGKTEFLYHSPPRKSLLVELATEDTGAVSLRKFTFLLAMPVPQETQSAPSSVAERCREDEATRALVLV